MKETNIIHDYVEIHRKQINIEFHIKNWGEPFDRPIFKKKVIQIVEQKYDINSEIKKIKAYGALHTYTSEHKNEKTPSIEDIRIIVELLDGKSQEISIDKDAFILS